MSAATLSRDGRIRIPPEVQEHLRVGAGDRLELTLEQGGSVRLVRARGTIDELYGLLKRPGKASVNLEEMDRAAGEYLAAEDQRIRDRRE
jgi:bifunctional DNA-binding transcriptional regulator/antitoxin component of YhaV-PrlF toxin-antitoxin module